MAKLSRFEDKTAVIHSMGPGALTDGRGNCGVRSSGIMVCKRLSSSLLCAALVGCGTVPASNGWIGIWSGEGYPPPVAVNGYIAEGTHLPLEFEFRFDWSTRSVREYDAAGNRLRAEIREWYVKTATKDMASSGVEWLKLKANDVGHITLYGHKR